MGSATTLRQLLRSLCHNTLWKYAVFWKLKHRSRMLLTWEDAYCDFPKPRDTVQHLPDNVCFNDTTFGSEIDERSLTSAAYSIGLAVVNMSCLLYALGEGIVGKVAFNGRHCWRFAHEFSSKLVPEYPEEWHLQFAAGIKTILLVPVVPHGVVQLGSLETVAEDLTLVAHIKDLFNTLQNVSGDSSPFTSSGSLLGPSSFPSPLFGDFAIPSAMTSNLMNPSQLELLMSNDPLIPDVGPVTVDVISTINPSLPPLIMVQDNLQAPQKTMQHLLGAESKGSCIDGNAREAMHGVMSANSSVIPYAQNQFMNPNHMEMTVNDISAFSCVEEVLQIAPHCDAVNPRISVEQPSMLDSYQYLKDPLKRSGQDMNANSAKGYDFCSLGHIVDQPFANMIAEEISHKTGSDFLSFPADSELHEALGPIFRKEYDVCDWDPAVSGEDGCSSSSLFCQTDGWFLRDHHDEEHLLDAVVASVYGALDENVPNRSNNIRSPSSSSGQLTISCQTQSRSEGGVLAGDNSSPWSVSKPGFTARGDGFAGSPTGSSSRTTSVLIDDGPQKMELGSVQSKKGMKAYQGSKRKARAGDFQRPRPRDRQMIQDRVKELREIVPNGAKCSIDALLERTIKHMLFLRNVTNQAEKLKQCRHPKVTGDGNENSSVPPQRQQNDGTWAFELGSQSGICPIIVENLDQPGHMLVEMLCEEHGLFLEIAQVIRHLELTILKGVMESRSDKIWAHFIVEASRGFQRMDILWPLMQLLQRNSNPIPSKF
ncbi:transcription factor EMB1444-like isoform X2 [Magnolia sinica]|uniref:transcription factor EMB1444-like isoform X2 n=1 Tax=Magnolia sinica TaxID=86752 RepID=UPI00265A00F4|nr:transcription factor EMB1444-like isoform X2 [Magnolia sinica]